MAKRENLKDKAYHNILESIFSSEYKPNQILNEKDLIEKLDCSKSPVREALIELCHDNVLRSIPRYGYEVVRMTRSDIEAILSYRLVLETGYLRTFCGRISEDQFETLEGLNYLCNKNATNLNEHWKYNMDFHTTLLSFSGNAYAVSQLTEAMQVLWRAYAQFYWNKWDNFSLPLDMRMHQVIIDSLRKKDADAAAQALADDLQDFEISGGHLSL